MPTIVGILTFICMTNTTSERFKAINFFICWYFSFYGQFKFRAQLSWIQTSNLCSQNFLIWIYDNHNFTLKKFAYLDLCDIIDNTGMSNHKCMLNHNEVDL